MQDEGGGVSNSNNNRIVEQFGKQLTWDNVIVECGSAKLFAMNSL